MSGLGGRRGPSAGLLLGLAVFLLTFLVFSPFLANGFVNWDDDEILGALPAWNPPWRNPGRFFADFGFGAYRPLPMLAWTAIYAAQGFNPFGFHVASVLAHALNAALFYACARFLLGGGAAGTAGAPAWAPALAALLFSLHPLRVEALAVAHFADIMAAGFFLGSLLAWLRAVSGRPSVDKRLLALSWALFACCGMSRWQGWSLPLLLVMLDFHPLRRLNASPREWLAGRQARVWAEKLPFAAIALAAVLLNLHAKQAFQAVWAGGASVPFSQGFVSLAFCAVKTAWPAGLTPFYVLSGPFSPGPWSSPAAAALVLGATGCLAALRRRWPGALVAWLHYAAALAPTLEFFHRTAMSVHDRYAYVSCMGFPVVLAAALAKSGTGSHPSPGSRAASRFAAVALLLVLGGLTLRQIRVWEGPESLWAQVLKQQPASFVARARLAAAIRASDPARAEALLRGAIAANPGYAEARLNLGDLLMARGDFAGAADELGAAYRLDPRIPEARSGLAMAHSNEGIRLARAGEREKALARLEEARRLLPEDGQIRANLELLRASMKARGGSGAKRSPGIPPGGGKRP